MNKYKIFSKYLYIILIIASGILPACKKFVDIKPAINLTQTEDLFASDTAALSAVSDVYVQMRSTSPSLIDGGLSIYLGLSSDELATTATYLEYDAFFKNSVLPTSNVVNSQLWAPSYRIIYEANSIIENLEKSTQLTEAAERQLLGEMKVVRALYYFYMTNVFGNVPLVTSTSYKKNEYMGRASADSIYQQIISDLKDAETFLTEDYPGNYRARPNKWTAAALLAKVYLYRNNWPAAENECSKIINSNRYNLETGLNQVFKNTSNETIWQIAPPNEMYNTVEGNVFIPYSSTSNPTMYATQSLLNSFEEGDLRKSNWLGLSILSGVEYYYPFKYKENTSSPVDEYNIVFRLGEILLIRAEALAHQNKIENAKADINAVRKRAGLSGYQETSRASLLQGIIKERQTELFAEWGNRWFDLKRNNLLSQVLASAKGGYWQPTDMLFPIPLSEIEINSALSQNSGY